MATGTASQVRGKVRQSYLALVQRFPLVSIKTDRELTAAQEMLDSILAQGRLARGDEMYLDALSDLIAVYEDRHHSIAAASDADMLRHLIDARGISQAELSRGAKVATSTVSEILAGKRPFSRRIIRKLADFFGVDVSVLSANQ
jgi:HTH-type transcriptional regulator/antitoxin HigA